MKTSHICGRTALALVAALALAGGSPRAARGDVYAGFTPSAVTVAPGDTFMVTVAITQADAQFNAFDASVRFDPSMLTFLPTTPVGDQRGEVMTSACSNTFHKFDAAPDSLKITLSLLCGGVFVTGPGALYHLKFIAGSNSGTTTLSLGPFTEFYRAGIFARPLHTQDMTVTITYQVGVPPEGRGGERLELSPPVPNPRRGSGSVLLEFALPRSDVVGFDVLDVQGRRVAERDAEWYAAGRHRLSWSPPALANGDYLLRMHALASGSVVQRWAVLR